MQLRDIFISHIDFKKHSKEYKTRFMTFSESQLFIDGQCKPFYANGLGCTLISKRILENIKFRVDLNDVGFADSFFYTDLWMAGIQNYVDTSIIPTHRNSDWDNVKSDYTHKKMQFDRGDLKLKK
jgi:hypothetical protein